MTHWALATAPHFPSTPLNMELDPWCALDHVQACVYLCLCACVWVYELSLIWAAVTVMFLSVSRCPSTFPPQSHCHLAAVTLHLCPTPNLPSHTHTCAHKHTHTHLGSQATTTGTLALSPVGTTPVLRELLEHCFNNIELFWQLW